MNITQRLQELDSTLQLHNEGDWQNPLDPNKPGFTSFNDAGVETETGEFLYAMVRVLKPEHVLETGTHWGVGSAYMGQALKDNKVGHLDTLEFLKEIWERAQLRMKTLGLEEVVTCHLADATKFDPEATMYQLMLLDTEPQTRYGEVVRFFDRLAPGGFVFIHDLHRHMHQIETPDHPESPYNGFAWPYGRIPKELAELVATGQLVPFYFPTPRGLTGFYKPHDGDYKW